MKFTKYLLTLAIGFIAVSNSYAMEATSGSDNVYNAQLGSRITNLENRVNGLSSDFALLLEEFDGLKLHVNTLKIDVEDLKTDVHTIKSALSILTTNQNSVIACSALGKIFAPSNTNADAKGCIEGNFSGNNTASVSTVTVEKSACYNAKKRERGFSVSCPANTTLISCSGGLGERDDSQDGGVIRPKGNGCELRVRSAKCSSANNIAERSNLYALCAKNN